MCTIAYIFKSVVVLNKDYSSIYFYLFGPTRHSAGVGQPSLAVVARHVTLQAPSSRLREFGYVPHEEEHGLEMHVRVILSNVNVRIQIQSSILNKQKGDASCTTGKPSGSLRRR